MEMRICNFPECGRKYRSTGLCDSHLRQKKQGRELTPLRARNVKPRESKSCRGCGDEKALTEFREHRHGYRIGLCRDCEAESYRKTGDRSTNKRER
ncbi:hypothetical protein ACFWVU_10650 [Streptomyces sp. NPDC058686]|uniref:hypothetical protein n=1 Tax=Streptomyces sp. NPDC058686 TaxID=3346599 RepID=UPI0036651C5F